MKRSELVKLLQSVIKNSSGYDIATRAEVVLSSIEKEVQVSYDPEQEPEMTNEELDIIE